MGILTITIARKPVSKGSSVAQNVLKHETGGINIDACRIGGGEVLKGGGGKLWSHYRDQTEEHAVAQVNPGLGRWPSNLIFSHLPDCKPNCPVDKLERQSGERLSGGSGAKKPRQRGLYEDGLHSRIITPRTDTGTASRFFKLIQEETDK
jgi:hypothetical protein